MGLISYYCLIVVVFVALIIYDLLFYMTFKNDVCPEITYELATDETTDEGTTNATNGTRMLKLIDLKDYYNNLAN